MMRTVIKGGFYAAVNQRFGGRMSGNRFRGLGAFDEAQRGGGCATTGREKRSGQDRNPPEKGGSMLLGTLKRSNTAAAPHGWGIGKGGGKPRGTTSKRRCNS